MTTPNLPNGTHGVKGRAQLLMDTPDRELVAEFVRAMRERNLSQMKAAERTGIGQSTISRLVRSVEAGEELRPLQPATRDAIVRFLGAGSSQVNLRALVLARELAANILEEVAEMLRAGSMPDSEAVPPTVRRVMATESRADDESPHWRAMERGAEELSEQRKRDRRKPRASGGA